MISGKEEISTYNYTIKKRQSFFILIGVLFLILLFTVFVSISMGAVDIPVNQIIQIILKKIGIISVSDVEVYKEKLFFSIRLPRVFLGILVGFALSISGAILQGLFKNPLSDPSLIGTSSGAVAAVVIFIILGTKIAVLKWLGTTLGIFALPVFAFLGALSATFLTYYLSKIGSKTVISTMLLVGVALNSFIGALIGLALYFADDSQLRSITFWSLGSLGGTNWNEVLSITHLIVISLFFVFKLSREMNNFLLGEAVALHLGTDVEKVKRNMIILTSLMTGAVVSVSGIIGFVGLIIPHLSRFIVGTNYKYLLPTSCLLGAITVIIADLVSRLIVIPAELPIGIITSLLGAPFFLWLILNDRNKQIN